MTVMIIIASIVVFYVECIIPNSSDREYIVYYFIFLTHVSVFELFMYVYSYCNALSARFSL